MRRGGSAALLLAVLAVAMAGCDTRGTDGTASGAGGEKSAAPDGPVPSWSLDRVLEGRGALTDLAVVAEDDIWAVGRRESAGTGVPEQFLVHGDGQRWREQSLPDALGTDPAEIRLDAVGGSQVWLTATVGELPQADENGEVGGDRTRILRFDGTAWVPLAGNPQGALTDLKGFAPDDVWAVVHEQVQHWDGARWTPRPVPLGKVSAVDGTDAHDLWAVGHRDTREPGGASEWTQPTATHWDGTAWRRTEVPEYHFPDPVPSEPGAWLDHVLALGEDDVLVHGSHSFNHGEDENEPDDEAIRLHWGGARWAEQPAAPEGCAKRAPVLGDGTHGVFLEGNRYLTADGECARIDWPRLPAEDGIRRSARQFLEVEEMARVPDGDGLIAVGHVAVSQGGDPMNRPVVLVLER